MKITFKPLNYQLDAVQAVVDVFRGQQQLIGQTRYTLDKGIQPTPKRVTQQAGLDFGETDILQNSALQTYDMLDDENIGFANTPLFDLNEILKNIQTVQANRQLPKSTELVTADNKKGDSLTQSPLNLNIEMETGTGKTYTYLRTIFEMNKQYGWSKFIIVVPSIAIREGVNLMKVDPNVVTGLMIGTVAGVVLFRGVAVGPLIAAGILSLLYWSK